MGSSSLGVEPRSAAPYVLPDAGYIPLRDRYGKARAWAVVDLADFPQLSKLRWHLSSAGYACSRRPKIDGGGQRWMHREVLGLARDDPREGDHIDRDTLNNRRSNLRIVTHAQNRQNTDVRGVGTSSYRGVSFDRSRGRWKAHCCISGHMYNLGRFGDERAAAEAAAAFRREHMPFAVD